MRIIIILTFITLCTIISNAKAFSDTIRTKKRFVPAIPETLPYYFTKKPFISPKIIEDLSSWISDGGDQVVTVNLTESQESNRYFGDIEVREIENAFPVVSVRSEGESPDARVPYFGYQYLGRTIDSIYILHTCDNGGGSLTSNSVMLLMLDSDFSLHNDGPLSLKKERRLLLKKVGAITLYGTWNGELKFDGKSKLYVGDEEEAGRWIEIIKP